MRSLGIWLGQGGPEQSRGAPGTGKHQTSWRPHGETGQAAENASSHGQQGVCASWSCLLSSPLHRALRLRTRPLALLTRTVSPAACLAPPLQRLLSTHPCRAVPSAPGRPPCWVLDRLPRSSSSARSPLFFTSASFTLRLYAFLLRLPSSFPSDQRDTRSLYHVHSEISFSLCQVSFERRL